MQLLPEIRVTKLVLTAFVWFFIAALIGLLLRGSLLYQLPWDFNYKFVLHAHSHVMFMGWLYNLLFIALVTNFVNPQVKGWYAGLFVVFQISVAGMLLSFPVQGYAAVSISFSTLHVLADYLFAYRFIKDTQSINNITNSSLSFARWAVFFMVLSSLGPYGLGYAMANNLQNTPFYHLCIYFYLHFQYNGWLVFGIFALVLQELAKQGVLLPGNRTRLFLWLMVVSCFLSYSLSALFTHPPLWVYLAGFVSGLIQLLSAAYIMPHIWQYRHKLAASGSIPELLLALAALSWGLKLILQMASAFPQISDFAYTHRNYIIAYLHLIFIGIGTFYFLSFCAKREMLSFSVKIMRVALVLLLCGFVITQTMLILQPVFVCAWLMAAATALLPLSALLFVTGIACNAKPNYNI